MSKLLDLLKATPGEAAIPSALGRWRLAASATVDQLVALVNNLTGGGLAPATGTTQGVRPLVGYATAALLPGAQVFVEGGIDEWYWWDPTSTLAADQLNVVRPTGLLVGNWIRERERGLRSRTSNRRTNSRLSRSRER
jgi:hypothetical protein